MAVSEETQAIIDRLKAEGDLIRNSGTNSLRVMTIKLDKFEGLFTSINRQLVAQTDLLRAQAGLAAQARRNEETRRQYEELTPPTVGNDSSPATSGPGRSGTERRIDDVARKLSSALSLKNLAVGAAGMFVGYNFLKGFINEKYNGAWDKMETGIGSLGRSLANIDTTKLTENITNFVNSLPKLTTMINDITKAFEDFKTKWEEYGWSDMISGIWNALSTVTLTVLGLKATIAGFRAATAIANYRASRNAIKMSGGDPTKVPKPDLPVASSKTPIGVAKDGRPIYDDPLRPGRYLDETGKIIPDSQLPDGMSSNPRANVTTNLGNIDLSGRNFVVKDGEFYSRSKPDAPLRGAARDAAQRALSADIIGGKVNIPGISTAPPIRATISDIGKQAGQRLRPKIISLAKDKVWKVFGTAIPIIGMGVGAWLAFNNLFKGDYTSAAANGVSLFLPTISGTAVDIGSVATEIFFEMSEEAFGEKITFNPANEAHVDFMVVIGQEVEKAIEQYKKEQADEKRREFDALPADERARIIGQQESKLGEYYRGQDPNYSVLEDMYAVPNFRGQTRDNYTGPSAFYGYGTGPNSNTQYRYTPNFGSDGKFRYFDREELGTIQKMSFNGGRFNNGMIGLASYGGVGGAPVVINAPQISAPVVNNVEGGKSANYIQMASFGGGGGGFGSDDPYNLSFIS